jgi:hypothetical protein
MAAAAVGALISGIAVYAVGARAQQSPFAEVPALVQTVDGQYVQIPNARPFGFGAYGAALQPAAVPAAIPVAAPVAAPVAVRQRTVAPTRTVYTEPVQERVVVREVERRPQRSWGKTALILGGSAASGAGVGALIGGKKGALAGAAIGGGAASIYEATRRR